MDSILDELYKGEVAVDESYIGGKEANEHASTRPREGRNTVGDELVIGVKERQSRKIRTEVIDDITKETLLGASSKMSLSPAESIPTTQDLTSK